MNKTQLIETVQEKLGGSQREAKQAVDAVFDAVADGLSDGESVVLAGFGTFSVKDRPARTVRNPQNGEPIQVPAKRVAHFKAGSNLQGRVN